MENHIPFVLIVDDVSTNVLLLKVFFKNQPYETASANSGQEALDIIEERKPNIILLDVMMPGLSGFDVAHKLAENKETKDINIIFLTALGEELNLPAEFENDNYSVVSKPFNKLKLFEKINQMLAQ
ncbi:MAG: response regulator [Bacteroidales bacterium]|nr:response regulator [Bacteroidales bacterium]